MTHAERDWHAELLRERQVRQISWLSLVVATVLVVGVVTAVVGLKAAAPPAQVVDRAVSASLEQKTAYVNVSVADWLGSDVVSAVGNGVMNFLAGTGDLQLQAQATDAADSNLGLAFSADTLYEQIPGISEVVPGKTWVSVDLSSLPQAASRAGTAILGSDNPAVLLWISTQSAGRVVSLGTSTVNTQTVREYQIGYRATQTLAPKAGAPAWVGPLLRQIKGAQTEQIYVNGAGQVVRMAVQATLQQPLPITVDETFDFVDWGSPVEVSLPAPASVIGFQQLLQKATPPQLT